MLALSDIRKLTATNRGGIAKTYLIFEKDVVSAPSYTPASGYWTGDLTLTGGAMAYYIYCTRSSLESAAQLDTSSVHGDFWDISLQGRTPRITPDVTRWLQRLMNQRVMLIYQDHNGHWRILRQLRCRPEENTGRPGGYNGALLRFSGKGTRPPGHWQRTGSIIPAADSPCQSLMLQQNFIGDPEADQIIGDPVSGEAIGWFS